MDEIETERTLVVIRPTADYGVTVNGIGLWPGDPEDQRGYTIKREGDWTVFYNFRTGHAEIYYFPQKDGRPEATVLYLVFSAFAFIALLFPWHYTLCMLLGVAGIILILYGFSWI